MPLRFSCVFFTVISTIAVHAEVKLPALLSDHMLLQQGKPVRLWGAAAPVNPSP